jgi:hypothetical protein
MKTEIDLDRLEELEKIEAKMCALEAHGVDNWEGYDLALEEIRAEERLDEDRNACIQEIAECLAEGSYEPAGRGAGIGFSPSSINQARKILGTFIFELKKQWKYKV